MVYISNFENWGCCIVMVVPACDLRPLHFWTSLSFKSAPAFYKTSHSAQKSMWS